MPAETLADALTQACRELDLSSVHATFCTEPEYDTLGEAGWLQRLGTQFHWQNNDYLTFDDFLGALSSRKRKSIRRERRDANACGLEFLALRGPEITRADWAAFYEFYIVDRGPQMGQRLPDAQVLPAAVRPARRAVVLMLARQGGRPVAGALNLVGSEALYGRNWGCQGDYPFLHFELCYYRAIDFAIAHGLRRVEAGAQGEHKIQRGYLPVPTYSAHWIAHSGLRAAVGDFLERERPAREAEMAELATLSPFRRDGEAE